MSVARREYGKDGKPIWGYAFSYRHRRYRKAGFLTKKEAEYAEHLVRQAVMVEGKSPTPSKRIRVADLLPLYYEQRQTEVAPTTVRNERRREKFLNRHFGKRIMDEISEGDILAFRTQRKNDGLCNRAVNIDLALVRQVFKFAMTKGYVSSNPTLGVKSLRQVIKDHPLISADKLELFMEEAGKTRTGFQLVVWLRLRALTGLRPSESLYLEWQDIDFVKEQIFVRSKFGSPLKTGKFRVVEIHPALKTSLLDWRRQWEQRMTPIGTPHQWVFFYPDHPEQRAESFKRSFERARAAAGIPQFRSYDLRHYFISKAIMSGVDTFTIAKWAGHSSTQMIDQIYGHLTPEFRAGQMARIKFDFLSDDHQESVESPSEPPAQQPTEEPAKPAIEAVVKPAPQLA
jgi:integrase